MEAVPGGGDARLAQGTGSKTIADLLPLAVEKYGDTPAQRFKVGDEWRDASYAELGETVRQVALGLIDLGIQPGEKISILAHTRPEWTHACFGILTAGATLVTIYQTNSPEECQYVLQHSNSRAITDAVVADSVIEAGDSTYLFLPLAHAFAILIQFATFELGATIAYWSRDPKQIIADIAQVSPSYFPSVPRMFEKIYTLATANVQDKEGLRKAVDVGVKVRLMRDVGEPVPEPLQQAFDAAEEQLFKNVRGLFGKNIRECVTGAAPIASEILEFFYACGVPVMEGYGMTETSTSATVNRPDGNNFRFGSVGRPQKNVEVRIGDDGEVLIKGPNIFKGYYKNEEATKETLEGGWLHTGDLGRLDEDGFLYITGRKKDIIITAGGKNITPANLENGLKQNRWISQAVVVGDPRPYPVALITLDPEEIVHFAREHGLPEELLDRLYAED